MPIALLLLGPTPDGAQAPTVIAPRPAVRAARGAPPDSSRWLNQSPGKWCRLTRRPRRLDPAARADRPVFATQSQSALMVTAALGRVACAGRLGISWLGSSPWFPLDSPRVEVTPLPAAAPVAPALRNRPGPRGTLAARGQLVQARTTQPKKGPRSSIKFTPEVCPSSSRLGSHHDSRRSVC